MLRVLSTRNLSILFVSFGLLISFEMQAQERPNILFILVDDLGYHDLSCTGSEFYETPNIDKLSQNSFRFTNGYASSRVCSPSRAGIMTGTSPVIHGITDWIGAPEGEAWRKHGRHTRLLPPTYTHSLPFDLETLPEAMKKEGYETFFAGKWHLGGEGSYPEDHGFDINIGGYESGSPRGGYFAPYDNPKMSQGPDGENLSLRLGAETAKYINEDHEQPFFAMLSFYAVHGPIQTTEDLWSKYRNKALAAGTADHGYEMERRMPIRVVQDNPVYAGLMETMDQAVGLVMEALEQAGLADNTIVVFTSDHGGVASGDNFSTSNLPLRGGKGYQWEGGLRVPFFIKVPNQNGGELSQIASNIDFMPTLIDMAGGDPTANSKVEGISLVPSMIKGQESPRTLFWHYPHYGNQGGDPSSIVRSGKWKMIYYWENNEASLYDLEQDPMEQTDISAFYPEEVLSLSASLFDYLMDNNARYPVQDPEYSAEEEAKVLLRLQTNKREDLEKQRLQMFDENWQPNSDWWQSKVTRD